jgi:hypothetical protein
MEDVPQHPYMLYGPVLYSKYRDVFAELRTVYGSSSSRQQQQQDCTRSMNFGCTQFLNHRKLNLLLHAVRHGAAADDSLAELVLSCMLKPGTKEGIK